MLKFSDAFSSFSVDDLGAARAFYEQALGFDVKEGPMGMLEVQLPVGGHVLIYPKPDHKPATFTVLNLIVADVEQAVDALVAGGITMERYDNPEMAQDAKGIARGNGPSIAWLTDPAGNVIAVIEDPRGAPG